MPSVYQILFQGQISTSTVMGNFNLAGYRDVAVLVRLDGAPNSVVYQEVYNDALSVAVEQLTLNQAGWLNFTKIYSLFAPDGAIVLYNPSAPMNVRFSVYAAI
jgi:hypothetical protein